MIYGVFSDVHSNYEALKAVLYYFRSRRIKSYLCCGDLVGYGPEPDKCVEAVAELPNLRCVSGNHDLGVVGELPLKWFNSTARCVIESTAAEICRRRLKMENLRSSTVLRKALQRSIFLPGSSFLKTPTAGWFRPAL